MWRLKRSVALSRQNFYRRKCGIFHNRSSLFSAFARSSSRRFRLINLDICAILGSGLAAKRTMANPKHFWLRTNDMRAVFTDQKGQYRLEWATGYVTTEFWEGRHPEIDMEKLAQEISEKLGINCRWIFQPK